MKDVFIVILDQYADWEAASIASWLNQLEDFTIKTVSINTKPIHSIGGFTTIPDYSIEEACQKEFAALILIGGNSWRTDAAAKVSVLVEQAQKQKAVIGAICDATVYLGTLGLLNNTKHTSNQLQDLQTYAGSRYTGANHYVEIQAIRDELLVTANGTANVEFAREISLALKSMPEAEITRWYNFYKLGYYDTLKQELRNGDEP